MKSEPREGSKEIIFLALKTPDKKVKFARTLFLGSQRSTNLISNFSLFDKNTPLTSQHNSCHDFF